VRVERADESAEKGWYAGPWDSELPVCVGYANAGVDEPHVHLRVWEIYLVARGSSTMRVERETVRLSAGDVIFLEPGGAHTFLESSPDYLHFVVQAPDLSGEAARAEKTAVSRDRLGIGE
jgi:mannose-6-phosphate isomerase-like protein (cupin superfamily)